MAEEVVMERPVAPLDEAAPNIVLFSDEEGVDLVDDVELVSLTSATLGAIVARRC